MNSPYMAWWPLSGMSSRIAGSIAAHRSLANVILFGSADFWEGENEFAVVHSADGNVIWKETL